VGPRVRVAEPNVSGRILTLPLYAHMEDEQVEMVIDRVSDALEYAYRGVGA
jgi:dTDP-4-amino-4,6-dideoxygalactose transaminase